MLNFIGSDAECDDLGTTRAPHAFADTTRERGVPRGGQQDPRGIRGRGSVIVHAERTIRHPQSRQTEPCMLTSPGRWPRPMASMLVFARGPRLSERADPCRNHTSRKMFAGR
jgi:hypothetical protein